MKHSLILMQGIEVKIRVDEVSDNNYIYYTDEGGCEVCEYLREKSRSSFHKNGSIFPKRPPCGTDLSKIRQPPNIL